MGRTAGRSGRHGHRLASFNSVVSAHSLYFSTHASIDASDHIEGKQQTTDGRLHMSRPSGRKESRNDVPERRDVWWCFLVMQEGDVMFKCHRSCCCGNTRISRSVVFGVESRNLEMAVGQLLRFCHRWL